MSTMRAQSATTAMWRWLRRSLMRGRSTRPLAAPNGHLASASISLQAPELPYVPADDSPDSLIKPLPGGEGTRGLPGRLIIVEGIDGSGKSTQLDLLRKWLVNLGYLVIFSEWNSSPIVKGITRRGKREQLLSPMSFSLIHAADFASRTYSQIVPALQSGAIVLADRYVYTAYARDAVRGVHR